MSDHHLETLVQGSTVTTNQNIDDKNHPELEKPTTHKRQTSNIISSTNHKNGLNYKDFDSLNDGNDSVIDHHMQRDKQDGVDDTSNFFRKRNKGSEKHRMASYRN